MTRKTIKLGLILFSGSILMAGCAATQYDLNIMQAPGIDKTIFRLTRDVIEDGPPNCLENEWTLDVCALNYLISKGIPPEPELGEDLTVQRAETELLEKLDKRTVSMAFETTYRGETAYHELTAGVIDSSFETFLDRFNPAGDWGSHLWRYKGGALQVDALDEGGKPAVQRERMVLSPPWFAIGAPDLDMSKYEYIEYGDDWVKVSWSVTESENKSVFVDDGFVCFKRLKATGQAGTGERTLVAFNSIHRVDPGPVGRALPPKAGAQLTLFTLKRMFSKDIKRYRQAVRAP